MFKGQAAFAAIFLTSIAPIMDRLWGVLTAGQTGLTNVKVCILKALVHLTAYYENELGRKQV
jgi:hypothetical protein